MNALSEPSPTVDSLKPKVTGEAKLNISSFSINNWAELKAALLNSYSDKRDVYTLTIELFNLKQNYNETPFENYQIYQIKIP